MVGRHHRCDSRASCRSLRTLLLIFCVLLPIFMSLPPFCVFLLALCALPLVFSARNCLFSACVCLFSALCFLRLAPAPAAKQLPRRVLRAQPVVAEEPAKRSEQGEKHAWGTKRATSVFTLFHHPSSAATPRATLPVPPIAPASRWWGCAESGRAFSSAGPEIFKG